jgi:hypothetical protein
MNQVTKRNGLYDAVYHAMSTADRAAGRTAALD